MAVWISSTTFFMSGDNAEYDIDPCRSNGGCGGIGTVAGVLLLLIPPNPNDPKGAGDGFPNAPNPPPNVAGAGPAKLNGGGAGAVEEKPPLVPPNPKVDGAGAFDVPNPNDDEGGAAGLPKPSGAGVVLVPLPPNKDGAAGALPPKLNEDVIWNKEIQLWSVTH
jgi:hypothetical protein